MSDPITEPAEEQTTQPETEQTTSTGVNYSSLINQDGTFKEEFYSSLPEELGSHSSIKQMKDVVNLAKSYMNTKSLVGKKLEEFWKSEDASIVAKRKEIMGIPDSADGYKLSIPENMPEESAYNEAALNDFKSKAAELGITQEQAEGLLAWDASRAVNASEKIKEVIQQQTQEAESMLRKEWGKQYDYNISKAVQATDHLGITETINELGLGRSPEFLKMVIEKLVPAISDDKLIETAKKDNLATVTDSLNDIESRMFSYNGNRNAPEYKALMKEREELLKKLS